MGIEGSLQGLFVDILPGYLGRGALIEICNPNPCGTPPYWNVHIYYNVTIVIITIKYWEISTNC